jgi:hypothetical protein
MNFFVHLKQFAQFLHIFVNEERAAAKKKNKINCNLFKREENCT